MATLVGDQPFLADQPALTYASLLKPQPPKVKILPLKPITYLHGEPIVVWDQLEIDQMIINESLQCVVVGQFSYG